MSATKESVAEQLQKQAHLPVLDGLRGLAILMVLIFHAALIEEGPWLDLFVTKIGLSLWVGVDLFFVLSGFLITGILLDAKGSSSYYKSFFARRFLRIFPLYYLLVVFALFIAPALNLSSAGQAAYAWRGQWWYWSHLSNYLAAQDGLRHLILSPSWSLAIEEQFYLFWPFVVATLSRKALLRTCFFLTFFACALRILLFDLGYSGQALYVLTPTRIDTLAVGGAIAILMREAANHRKLLICSRIVFLVSGVIATTMLLNGEINKRRPQMIDYGYTTIALLFGSSLVLLLNCSPTSLMYRIFASRLLSVFGMYSYGIYLVNRPLVNLLNDNVFNYRHFPTVLGSSLPGQLMFALLLIGVSLSIAVMLYHVYEKHFLKLKRYFPK